MATFSSKISSRNAELKCDACNSNNIKDTREGYACGDCGIVLEILKFQYDRPYNVDSLQNAVLGSTQIGTKRERLAHASSVRLESMQKLHSIKDHEKVVSEQAKIEISRILACLSLPSSHKDLIFRTFKKFRKALNPGTKYRTPKKLVPLCVYYSLKLQNASINQNKLLDVSEITKKEFNAFKLQVKSFLPEYAERNRKDYVLQKVLEISEHFELGMEFFYTSKKILYKFWEEIKCTTDDVVAGLVCSISVLCSVGEKTSVSAICNRIGIRMSTIQAQVKKRIFDRFKIGGFVTLKKSAFILKKVMARLGLVGTAVISGEESDIVEIKLGSGSKILNPFNNVDYYFYAVRDQRGNPVLVSLKIKKEKKKRKNTKVLASRVARPRKKESFKLGLPKYSSCKGPPFGSIA